MNALDSLYEQLAPVSQLLADDEAALWAVAVHEIAHSFVATRLGLESDELIVSADAGVCVHSPGTSLQHAAVSWAGIISEVLLNAPHKSRTLPKTKLSSGTLPQWVFEVRLHELSASDRAGIEAHQSKYEPAQLAFDILSSDLETLEHLARRCAERHRQQFALSKDLPAVVNKLRIQKFVREQNEIEAEKQSAKRIPDALEKANDILASLPPCSIPTAFTFESFMDATGATADEIENFCRFRVQRERWQVGLGAPTPERIQTAVKFFQANEFQTRDTWLQTARDFFAWRKGELRSL